MDTHINALQHVHMHIRTRIPSPSGVVDTAKSHIARS